MFFILNCFYKIIKNTLFCIYLIANIYFFKQTFTPPPTSQLKSVQLYKVINNSCFKNEPPTPIFLLRAWLFSYIWKYTTPFLTPYAIFIIIIFLHELQKRILFIKGRLICPGVQFYSVGEFLAFVGHLIICTVLCFCRWKSCFPWDFLLVAQFCEWNSRLCRIGPVIGSIDLCFCGWSSSLRRTCYCSHGFVDEILVFEGPVIVRIVSWIKFVSS